MARKTARITTLDGLRHYLAHSNANKHGKALVLLDFIQHSPRRYRIHAYRATPFTRHEGRLYGWEREPFLDVRGSCDSLLRAYGPQAADPVT